MRWIGSPPAALSYLGPGMDVVQAIALVALPLCLANGVSLEGPHTGVADRDSGTAEPLSAHRTAANREQAQAQRPGYAHRCACACMRAAPRPGPGATTPSLGRAKQEASPRPKGARSRSRREGGAHSRSRPLPQEPQRQGAWAGQAQASHGGSRSKAISKARRSLSMDLIHTHQGHPEPIVIHSGIFCLVLVVGRLGAPELAS